MIVRFSRAGIRAGASKTALLIAVAVLCGCSQKGSDKSQVAARVNSDDISVHQVSFALAKHLGKEGSAAERDAMLERLIDRQLAVQQALGKKLDRRPDIMLRLEEARRDILAAAYADETGARVLPPDDQAITAYYSEHPALFANRKVYRLREITIPAESPSVKEMRLRMERKESLAEAVDWLRRQGGSFSDQPAIRAADQLPIEITEKLALLKPGESISFSMPRALVIYQVISAETVPISRAAAAPIIRAHLKNQKETAFFKEELARLRKSATISRTQAVRQ